MKARVLVSMCLMGIACRYDGRDNAVGLDELMARCELIPVCPEQLGGLTTPRPSAERRGSGVFTKDGAEVTAEFRRGAEQAVLLARRYGARYALLKARSPSCGVREIYDGSFTGALIPGMGMTAEALREAGLRLYDEYQIDKLLKELDGD